jgi:hypothetical protein
VTSLSDDMESSPGAGFSDFMVDLRRGYWELLLQRGDSSVLRIFFSLDNGQQWAADLKTLTRDI